jgi:hypothetical protein
MPGDVACPANAGCTPHQPACTPPRYRSHAPTACTRDRPPPANQPHRSRKTEAKPAVPARVEVERLRRANERLAKRLAQAEKIIEIQGKVSELLGLPLDPASDDEQSASS